MGISAIHPLLAGPAFPSSICGALGAWLGGWTEHVQLGKTTEEVAEEQRIEFLSGGGVSQQGWLKTAEAAKKKPLWVQRSLCFGSFSLWPFAKENLGVGGILESHSPPPENEIPNHADIGSWHLAASSGKTDAPGWVEEQ